MVRFSFQCNIRSPLYHVLVTAMYIWGWFSPCWLFLYLSLSQSQCFHHKTGNDVPYVFVLYISPTRLWCLQLIKYLNMKATARSLFFFICAPAKGVMISKRFCPACEKHHRSLELFERTVNVTCWNRSDWLVLLVVRFPRCSWLEPPDPGGPVKSSSASTLSPQLICSAPPYGCNDNGSCAVNWI